MGHYRDLKVWQKSMNFVEEIYKINFPKKEEFALASQIRRSIISVPSNIAEGNGRNSIKEYIRFLQISNGSLYEVQTQLEISFRLNYIEQEQFNNLYNLSRELEAMLKSMINKLSTSVPQNS